MGPPAAPALCLPLLLCYAGIALYLVLLGSLLSSSAKRAETWKAAGRLLSALRPSGRGGEYSLDVKVRELVARERVRCVRGYVHPFLHCFAVCIACTAVLPFSWGRCGRGPAGAEMLNIWAADVIQLLLHFLMCAVFVVAPRLITTPAIDCTYVVFTVWWSLRIWLVVDAEDVPLAAFTTCISRVVMGVIACNAGVTSMCNVVVMITHCFAFRWHIERRGAHRVVMSADTDYLVVQEVVSTAFIVLILFFFEHWVWAAARQMLEIKASSQAEVTVRRLLSALCDAVVTLGPDLRISARAPKLANLLLQGRSTRALEGMLFLDFMADTDQDRFRHFLARAPDHAGSRIDPEPAQALNVHLRDSSGISVQVQLFHSHFQDMNDQVGHLIGICEVGDSGGARVEVNEGHASFPDTQVASASTRASGDSVSTNLGNVDSDSETSLVGDSASVVISRNLVEANLGGMRIGSSPVHARPNDSVPPLRGPEDPRRRASQHREVLLSFEALRFVVQDRSSGPPVIDASLLEKESLQQWVAEWASCRAWMQDFVNAVLRPVTAASWPARAGAPTSLSFQVAFRGTCALPSDILTRTAAPSSVVPSATERVEVARWPSTMSGPSPSVSGGGSTDGGGGGGRGPPARLQVHRVRLARRLRLSPASGGAHGAVGSSASLTSDGNRRHNNHSQSVQHAVLMAGSMVTPVADAVGGTAGAAGGAPWEPSGPRERTRIDLNASHPDTNRGTWCMRL